MNPENEYIPALGLDWLTPLYDPVLKWLMHEERFKRDLVQHLALQPGQRALDLGCGTATLTLMLKQAQPAATLFGLDGDSQVLAIAKAKFAHPGVEVLITQGLASALPYPDGAFDRVVTSLVLHHLTRSQKQLAFAESLRVLCPGGELYVVDFGQPRTPFAMVISQGMRQFEQVADNLDGLLPNFMHDAGFDGIEICTHYPTMVGTLTLLRGRKPGWPELVG
jgi:ubiquinone/menaquinone biosynthesis C-methylase UbiE